MQQPNMRDIYLLIGEYTKNAKASAVALLNLNGVNITVASPTQDVQIAFLKAIKDSESFREQASVAMHDYLQGVASGKYHNFMLYRLWPPMIGYSSSKPTDKTVRYFFAGEPGTTGNTIKGGSMFDPPTSPKRPHKFTGDQHLNSTGGVDSVDYTDTADTFNAAYSPVSVGIANTSTPTINVAGSLGPSSAAAGGGSSSSSSSSSGGSVWSSLAGLLPTVIKTGLGVVSANATANANKSSESTALQIELQKTAQAQAAAQAAANTGMSSGAKAAIWISVVLGLGLVGFVAYKISKRRKAA